MTDKKGDKESMSVDQRFVTEARAAFLEHGIETAEVRPETLAGWRRSKAAGVAATGQLTFEPRHDFDEDSSLLRAVRPVTDDLMRQFDSSEVAMMVTDRDARIVGRWTSGSSMQRHLDRMGVFPGSEFDESYVGSTGLGTVLESGRPSIVDGAEHFNSSFDAVVAVGAPIIHPGTGVVEGVVDVVCPTGAPVELMLPLILRAAKEAGDRLVTGYAMEDRELLDAFMQSERRGPRRPVIALNGRLMMANTQASYLLGNQPHAVLWEQVHRAILDGQESIEIGTGVGEQTTLGKVREVRSADGRLGAVLQVGSSLNTKPRKTVADSATDVVIARVMQTLSGRSLRWTAAVRQASKAVVERKTAILVGPSGAGKSSLAKAILAQVPVAGSSLVVAACDLPEAIPVDSAVIVENVHELDSSQLNDLQSWLQAAAAAGTRCVATARSGETVEIDPDVSGLFSAVVTIAGLSHRAADIPDLINGWCGTATRPHVDAAVLRELMRRPWPGNVTQLFHTLDSTHDHGGGSAIRLEDLPACYDGRSTARALSYLENVEREAISRLLDAAGGNKNDVARELGIARSTLYRKLASLGLDI